MHGRRRAPLQDSHLFEVTCGVSLKVPVAWSSGLILAQGARCPGFNSWSSFLTQRRSVTIPASGRQNGEGKWMNAQPSDLESDALPLRHTPYVDVMG